MKHNTLMNTRIFADNNSGEGASKNLTITKGPAPMPTSDAGKAIASRNATTHGLFARDVVLPSLGEDPDGYRQLEGAWTTQLVPHNLLEQHYVEKIGRRVLAAATPPPLAGPTPRRRYPHRS